MNQRLFASTAALHDALAALLCEKISNATNGPHALMLAGGNTPLAAYELVARSRPPAGPDLHLTFSDERMVPDDSPLSNFGKARSLIEALALPPDRLLRVNTSLPLGDAAHRWHAALAAFFRRGGKISLGLLGLGADGHTASLFSRADVEQGRGRYAVAVPRLPGPDRVSVTADVLARVERLLFVVAGADKKQIVEQLLRAPTTIPAGLATAANACVEIWYAES